MASGDIFSDTNIIVVPGTLISIQPAAEVQVCITHMWGSNDSKFTWCGGGTSKVPFPNSYGTTGYSDMLSTVGGGTPMKLFITNTEYINIVNTDLADTFRMGYTGIEI